MWATPRQSEPQRIQRASARTRSLIPNREWAIIQLTTEDRELPKLLDILGKNRKLLVRICGDCLRMVQSSLKEGSFGYVFVHDPSGKYNVDLQYMGTWMKDVGGGSRLITVPEIDIINKSFSRQDLKELSYKDMAVEILEGDFRKLKGVVVDEHQFDDGVCEVDVEITTMTLTRIVNVRKDRVRPLEERAGRSA